MIETGDGEPFQFSVATGKRANSVDQLGLIGAVQAWWVAQIKPFITKAQLTSIAYSEWGTAGFTGFHQLQSVLYSDLSSVSNSLPPQNCLVVSLLNLSEQGAISIRSRRGRAYISPIPVGAVDANGYCIQTNADDLRTRFKAVDPAMRAVAADPSVSGFGGLCIASPTTGYILNVDRIGVGKGVDTQRRRRQKVSESITYATVP